MDKKQLAIFLAILFVVTTVIGQFVGALVFFKFNNINVLPSPITLLHFYSPEALLNLPYKVGLGISGLIPIVTTILVALAMLKPPKRELHGSARFANLAEITKAGLFKTDQKDPELLIGQFNGRYLRWSGKQFAFLAAPTRSGKGVGIVIPNCLNYRDSMIVLDPKLENFKITSGYRHQVLRQEVFLFNPSARNYRSHCWNPLSYISRDPYRMIGDALNIANILYSAPEGGDQGNAKFFAEMAQKLFLGLVLYMIEEENWLKDNDLWDEQKEEKLPTMARLQALTTPDPKKYKNCADWIKKEVSQDTRFSRACIDNLLSYATTSEQTGASILSSLIAPLSVFFDPIIEKVTSKDDFDLRDVRKKRMTIYMGINPNDMAKFGRLLNLFISQLISVNTEELPEDNPDLKYQCLLLLDEFTAMGKVDIIEKSVAYIAGYNLRLLPIFQNMSQLNRLYTIDGARSMSTNFECHIIYPPRDNQNAKEYSEILGTETFKAKSTSRNKGSVGNSSVSISDQSRAILNPTELKTMPTTDCIISMTGINPIRAKKIIYYEDDTFKSRLGYKPPTIPLLDLPGKSKAKNTITPTTDEPNKLSDLTKNILKQTMSYLTGSQALTSHEQQTIMRGFSEMAGSAFDTIAHIFNTDFSTAQNTIEPESEPEMEEEAFDEPL